MFKQVSFALLTAIVLSGSSGCCCLWHKVHTFKQSLHCHGCGGDCGGHCGGGCADGACGCGDQACGGGCGHDGGWGCFDFGWGCNNACSIFGCGSHYLDPQGACYGAYCGKGCQEAGCGPMYWGDAHNVPRTTDPCDCCGNFVGPSHNLHGSTPWYYGPPKGSHGYGGYGYGPSNYVPGHGHPPVAANEPVIEEQIVGETVVKESIVEHKPAPRQTKTAARPSTPRR
jgi:hypothetical protein